MILVTGGAGFIGANFVMDWLAAEGSPVVNLDKLTYAGNLGNLVSVANDARHTFVQGDINDRALMSKLLKQYRPHAIVHLAGDNIAAGRWTDEKKRRLRDSRVKSTTILSEAAAKMGATEDREHENLAEAGGSLQHRYIGSYPRLATTSSIFQP